ncbi:amidohydrolase family protein [Pseudarthrobacter sp. fls2-241-R2A-168]|uniref:amidohydrolase family protein n=1 Tax=Pseudarthrobacter sp. fls2-241-R2A-168 TaxID=3040304 RepID=UPI002552EE16|nr:amidohydrolase family protein [Pseudarthrobacter sp. fls2-241-R2A-168]
MTYFDHEAPLICIRGAEVYAPEPLGQRDVLVEHGRIAAIGDTLELDGRTATEIDGRGMVVVPGFIDSHLHITGGGSIGAGPISREPEFGFGEIVSSGVTTAIACQGADYMSRSYEALLQKARGLTAEGLSTFLWNNGFNNPPTALTGNIARDLFLVPEIIGSKIAIGDFLAPPWTPDELHRLLWQVLSGAQMSGKIGAVHVHAGVLPGGLSVVSEVIARYDFRGVDETSRHGASRSVGGHFQITHCNWNEDLLNQTIELCGTGAYADVTAGMPDASGFGSELDPATSVMKILAGGISERQITVSSDAGGNEAYLDEYRRVQTLVRLVPPRIHEVFTNLINMHGLPIELAVRMTSTNVAELQEWPYKGRIFKGADADLLLLDAKSLVIDSVIASGRLVVHDGKVIAPGITSGRAEIYQRPAPNLAPLLAP